MAEGDDTEKTHEPTPRKLEEARKRGELPKLAEVTGAAGMAGFLVLLVLPGGWVAPKIADLGYTLLERADSMGPHLLSGGAAAPAPIYAALGWALAPAGVVPAVLVLAVLCAFRGLVFAPKKWEPKLSRISPLSNAKQKFGPSGLFEFAKSAAKLAIFCGLLWAFLLSRLPEILEATALAPGQITLRLGQMVTEFLALIVVIMVIVGGIDTLWQHFDHRRQQRMSHKELQDEHKEAEGDPHMKQQRRAKAMDIASNQMLADMPTASVVIVNPTHYAVALRWSPGDQGAPVCVAKGVDEIAARIREAAQEHGVPVHSDPPTARALYATTRIGAEVHPDHYQPVAAAIRFAEAMRRKARQQARPKARQNAHQSGLQRGQTPPGRGPTR